MRCLGRSPISAAGWVKLPNVSGNEQMVVGWKEWVALPDLGIDWLKAKMDTGARSSALHAWGIEIVDADGLTQVRFEIHPWQASALDAVTVELPLVDRRQVRSSTGHVEDRLVVATTLQIGDLSFPTELTLTNRDSMGLRMLVGRRAMKGKMLVDSAGAYRTGQPPREIRARNRARR